MKAIGFRNAGPLSADNALEAFEIDTPELALRDLLVDVRGVSVNPVDVKVRAGSQPKDEPRILGYDAAGVVTRVGESVTGFKVGDEVFYSGDISRPGTNAEFHAVDERIVGRKPASLDFPTAAGMPLTSITAWEILFDSFGLNEGDGDGETLLILGGAGGVGSILIQLAAKLTGLKVVATASRPETVAWATKMGADHVINHHGSLVEQLAELGLTPRYVASLTHTDQHLPAIIELIAPRGHITVIDDPGTLDVVPLKTKALTLSWELMFTRSLFETADMDAQRALLDRVADLLDDGTLIPTITTHAGALTVDNLKTAHALQETGKAIGKTVLGALETPC